MSPKEGLEKAVKFLKEVMAEIPEGKSGTIEFIDEYKAVFKEDE